MKFQFVKQIVLTAALASSVACPIDATAAVDMFLKMDTIKGESQDKTHKGEIDVLAWSWGTSAGTAVTKRGTIPATCITDLSLTKWVDAATPQLIMNGMTGAIVPTAKLTVRKSGEDQLEYLVLTMKNVQVSAYSTGGSGGEDRLTENVTLHFDRMNGAYYQPTKDGTLGTPITWDITSQSSGRGCN